MFRGALAFASARLAQSACDGCSFDVTSLEEFSIDFEVKVAVFPEFFETAGPVFTTAHLPDNLPSEHGSLALHARNLQLKLDNHLSFPTQMPHVPHNEEMDQDLQQLSGMQIHEELHINGAAGVASLHVDSPIMNLCFQLDHLPTVIAQQLQQEQRHDVISQQLQQAEQVVPALLQQHGVRATVDGEDVVGWKTGVETTAQTNPIWTRVAWSDVGSSVFLEWDIPPAAVEELASRASRVKIQDRNNPSRFVVSHPHSYPIQDVRQGQCIGHGRTLDSSEVDDIWSASDPSLLGHMLHNCQPNANPSWTMVHHACGNVHGLHWMVQDGLSKWDYSGASVDLELYVDAAQASNTQESAGSWPGANAILFDNSTSHPALVLLGAATPQRPDDVSLALKFSNYNNSVGDQFAVRACEIETQIATQSFLATNPETRTFIASRIATHQNRLKALLQPQTLNSRFNFIPLEIAGLMVTAESSCATELAQIPQSGSFTFQIAVCAAFSFVVGIGTTRFLGKKSVTPADEYLLNAA